MSLALRNGISKVAIGVSIEAMFVSVYLLWHIATR